MGEAEKRALIGARGRYQVVLVSRAIWRPARWSGPVNRASPSREMRRSRATPILRARECAPQANPACPRASPRCHRPVPRTRVTTPKFTRRPADPRLHAATPPPAPAARRADHSDTEMHAPPTPTLYRLVTPESAAPDGRLTSLTIARARLALASLITHPPGPRGPRPP